MKRERSITIILIALSVNAIITGVFVLSINKRVRWNEKIVRQTARLCINVGEELVEHIKEHEDEKDKENEKD